MRLRFVLMGILLSVAMLGGRDLPAQEDANCGANECFSPEFDIAYETRPSVGWFGLTELMIAALEANLEEVERLVEQGADIEAADDTGGTTLMWAVQGGNIDIVNFLLDRGADVRAVGGRNASALMMAVISGHEDIGVRLLDAGATFSGELSYQQDYLEYAAGKGQATMVRALIDHGANLEESGADALCLASRSGHVETARALIEMGVDVNQRGSFSNDLPLIHALQANNEALVRLLVDNGADPNRKDKADRASILYYATQTGQPAIVTYLLDNGARLSQQEADQLLASAIYKGSMEMIDLFISSGATVSTRNLFNAIGQRQYVIADRFADAIGLETFDDYQLDSLIEQAANSGHIEMVGELLAIVDAREAQGHLRLLFESAEGDHCKLQTWDPQARANAPTVVAETSCDARLFVARQYSSLFVLEGQRIDVYSIDGAFSPYSLDLPERLIDARIDELRTQFANQYAGNYEWVSAEVVTIGYLDNGQVTLITHTGGPADGTYATQFAWDGSTWTLADKQGCHRFDWICHMPGVDGRSIDRWPMRRAVWHPALQRNPGFVERVTLSDGDTDGFPRYAAIFEFTGNRVEIGYALDSSDHCAVECTFTADVSLNPENSGPVTLPLTNSRVSIADQFILTRPIREGARVHDMVTGQDLFGEIGRASWIH